MAETQENVGGLGRRGWRLAAWVAVVALILSAPLIAMQLTDEVVWDLADFVFAGALLAGVAVAYELAVGKGTAVYRTALAIALAAALLLVWINAAVGIIGAEGDRANLMYFAVLAVGIVGAVIARLQPAGMANALFATALAQALVAAIALTFGLGAAASSPAEIVAVNGIFVALFVGSACLFLRAARERPPAGAVQ